MLAITVATMISASVAIYSADILVSSRTRRLDLASIPAGLLRSKRDARRVGHLITGINRAFNRREIDFGVAIVGDRLPHPAPPVNYNEP